MNDNKLCTYVSLSNHHRFPAKTNNILTMEPKFRDRHLLEDSNFPLQVAPSNAVSGTLASLKNEIANRLDTKIKSVIIDFGGRNNQIHGCHKKGCWIHYIVGDWPQAFGSGAGG